MEWGVGGQAGHNLVVWEGSWTVVGVYQAGEAVPLSIRRVQMNASTQPYVMAFPGL